jgi:hypothetical protein
VARFKETTEDELALMDRLITDLNMVPVWEAINAVKSPPGLAIDFFDAVRKVSREWRLTSRMPKGEIDAEMQKMADGAHDLAQLLRANAAETFHGRGPLELGPLICVSQGHDYLEGLEFDNGEDPNERDLRAEFSPEHSCRIFPFYRMAVDGDRAAAELVLREHEFDPPTCPRPSFNPLTTEAYSHLPSVEKLLDSLATWLRTPRPDAPDDLRPTKVGGKSAGRTFMARVLSQFFRERLGEPKHTLVAITVRAALGLSEEDKFGADHVRKAAGQPA